MAVKNNKYSTAFSAGSLLLKEAEAIIMNIQDPDAFMQGDEDVNFTVIPVNSEASKKRLGLEVKKRLRSLGDAYFIHVYKNGEKQDKNLILFYAACKAYRLITDFLIETVLDKWYHLNYELGVDDFKNFLYRKMDKHQELENLTLTTIKRRSSTVVLMMKEVGILKDGKLQKNQYNPTILKRIALNGDGWFLEVLLLSEYERDEILQQ